MVMCEVLLYMILLVIRYVGESTSTHMVGLLVSHSVVSQRE
jgi:hypothetical protein